MACFMSLSTANVISGVRSIRTRSGGALSHLLHERCSPMPHVGRSSKPSTWRSTDSSPFAKMGSSLYRRIRVIFSTSFPAAACQLTALNIPRKIACDLFPLSLFRLAVQTAILQLFTSVVNNILQKCRKIPCIIRLNSNHDSGFFGMFLVYNCFIMREIQRYSSLPSGHFDYPKIPGIFPANNPPGTHLG